MLNSRIFSALESMKLTNSLRTKSIFFGLLVLLISVLEFQSPVRATIGNGLPSSIPAWSKYSLVKIANSASCLSNHVSPVVFTGAGLNDATSGGTYTATTATNTYTVIIDATGVPDTFKWQKNAGSFTSGVAITGAAQTLTDGVTIAFVATTGHTLNNQWVITGGLGCWQVNGGTPVIAAAGLTQDVSLFQLPANGFVSGLRMKTSTAWTGTATATATLGTATNDVFFISSAYNLKTAVAVTNFSPLTGLTVGLGSTTTAAVNVVIGLISTVNNLDAVVTGSAVDICFQTGVLP